MSASRDFKISPANLLEDWGAVEDWSNGDAVAPTGWAAAGTAGAIAKEATTIKSGNYAMKVTSAAGATYGAELALANFDDWAGRTMRFGAWVKCASASKARVYLHDSFTKTPSSFHAGDNAWAWLEVGAQVGQSNTYLKFGVEVAGGSIDSYFDGMVAVEGETIFTAFQDTRTFLREVDVQPSISVDTASFNIARKEGVFLQATKVGPRNIKLRVQMYGDTMSEARTYHNTLIKACAEGVKDLYLTDDRLMKVQLAGLPSLKYQADLNVYTSDINFIAPKPYEQFIGRLRKKQTVTASPTSFSLSYNGNYKSRPQVSIFATATLTSISLENQTTGQVMAFGATVSAGVTLFIDCEEIVVENNAVDSIGNFTGDYLLLVPGTNNLKYTGSTNCVINVDWFDRWL